MLSTTLLAAKLQADYPQFTFMASDNFRWSPLDNTVFYIEQSDNHASLLHEASHALLGHADYAKDITLIEMERDAWEYARRTLSPVYEIPIDETTVQTALDTYRDWLHARSTCPTCQATGVQQAKNQYKCLACHGSWRVNDARVCALRRYGL